MNSKKNKMKNGLPAQAGYTLLELLFYITFFTLLSLIVINAMITMSRLFKETAIQGELVQSGLILERISREIRGSYNIASIAVGQDDLMLNTKDSAGIEKTIEFKLSGSNIQLWENNTGTNTFIGNLNAPNILVTGLTFMPVYSVNGKAVKIFFTVRSINDPSARTFDFYDTIIMRGFY